MTLLPPDNQPTKINLAPELGLDNLGDEVCAEYQAVADRVYGAATGSVPQKGTVEGDPPTRKIETGIDL
jgi:hypothetical protein